MTPPEQLDLSRFDLPALLAGCVENLRAVYDQRTGLFPYSTTYLAGDFVNDYEHPQTIRYTINSLIGLDEAARAGTAGLTSEEVGSMIESFLDRQLTRVETCADLGLLTLLLTRSNRAEAPAVIDATSRLASLLPRRDNRELNMQDLAWTIWGACSAARHGVDSADALARTAFDLVRSEFVDPRTGLPRHSRRRYRRNVVSFGSVTYFLRAALEYASLFDDETAKTMFADGVERAIDLQGPLGEWPWMIGVRSASPFDVYPVFSVHQDSMAMLFLLPAHDRGAPRAKSAIERSLAWGFGANELSAQFYVWDPFHAYRSIERVERSPRARRYGRSVAHQITGKKGGFGGPRVRVNHECRSYHLGWLLFAWAGRPEARVRASPSRSRSG